MTQTYWEQVRIQAAIAAMHAIMCSSVRPVDIAKYAVRQADELIEELQKEK